MNNQLIKSIVVSMNWVTDLKEAYKNIIGGRLSDYETIIDKEINKEVEKIVDKGYFIKSISSSQITSGAIVFTIIAEKLNNGFIIKEEKQ